MNKTFKLTIIIIGSIIVSISLILFAIYNFSFKPKNQVVSINSEIQINDWDLLKKFLPKDFNLSLKEVYVESNTNFSENELTDLFILGLQEIPEISDYLTGLKIDINNNLINVFLHITYLDIPVEAKLSFSCMAENGKGIFHYESGEVGFLKLSKDIIFNNLVNNSIIQFDKDNGNIILSFDSIKQLNVQNITIENHSINIVFRGTLKFWDWLKT